MCSRFQYNGVASHVLLAARAANEPAIEGGQGSFTDAFLNTISGTGCQNLAYAEIIARLPPLNK
jgi:hypothetical protein